MHSCNVYSAEWLAIPPVGPKLTENGHAESPGDKAPPAALGNKYLKKWMRPLRPAQPTGKGVARNWAWTRANSDAQG
jgi:hypothetical protein